uniref:Stathmin, putative n=1 Tax=Brugia malayi TaxID=6279 RepID=A8PHN3_BRUMA
MRDKEDIFNEYVQELEKKEKEERKERKEKMMNAIKLLIAPQVVKAFSVNIRIQLPEESNSDIEEENDRQKRVAAEAAIEERKKEVEAELGEQLKERSKEHEKHKISRA